MGELVSVCQLVVHSTGELKETIFKSDRETDSTTQYEYKM